MASTLRTVSLGLPSRRLTAENSSVGGLAATPLKNENGATLTTPAGETVLTQAMGRGVIRWTIIR